MTEINHRCAVLGKPIAHSLSPVLHNAAYRALDLDDWFYDKHEVGETDLESFLESLDSSWSGLSLTMPLKKTVQPYGTPCNSWARELRVSNTAVFDWTNTCRNGNTAIPAIRLYNTDVKGIELAFDHAFQSQGMKSQSVHSGEAVIIGNGNTATSALAACTEMSWLGHVTIVARHPDKNAALISSAVTTLSTSLAWIARLKRYPGRTWRSIPSRVLPRIQSPISSRQKMQPYMACCLMWSTIHDRLNSCRLGVRVEASLSVVRRCCCTKPCCRSC